MVPDDLPKLAGPLTSAASAVSRQAAGQSPGLDPSKLFAQPRPTSFFGKVVDYLSRPLYAVTGAVSELLPGEGPIPGETSPFKGAMKGFMGEDPRTGSDLLGQMGVENRWVKGIGGFGLDVALDPITYLTAGFGGGAKVGIKGGAVILNRAGQSTLKGLMRSSIDDLAKAAMQSGKALPAGTLLKQAQALARQRMAEMIEGGARHLVDRGGLKVGIPFTRIERTIVAGGPVGAAANVAGSAVDKAVSAVLAPVGRGISAVVGSKPGQMIKKAFSHSTGFLDVDELRQFAKGSENVFGSQFVRELDDFAGRVRGLKLSEVERQLVTLGAEEPAKLAQLAAELGLKEVRPELAGLTKEFSGKWKEWGNLLRSKGVHLPELGSGVLFELQRYQRIEAQLAERLGKAQGRERAKLLRDMNRLQTRRANLEGAARRLMAESEQLAKTARTEAERAALRARHEALSRQLARMEGAGEKSRQAQSVAQQRLSGAEAYRAQVHEALGKEPKTARLPVPVPALPIRSAELAGEVPAGLEKFFGAGEKGQKIWREFLESGADTGAAATMRNVLTKPHHYDAMVKALGDEGAAKLKAIYESRKEIWAAVKGSKGVEAARAAAGKLRIGDRVIIKTVPPGGRKIRTFKGIVTRLPSKATRGAVKVGDLPNYLPLTWKPERVQLLAGPKGARQAAAEFRQYPKTIQRAARATRSRLEAWAHTRAVAGDEAAGELVREIDRIMDHYPAPMGGGVTKEGHLKLAEVRKQILAHAQGVYGEAPGVFGDARLWGKIRPELEKAGVELPLQALPSPKAELLRTELAQTERLIAQAKGGLQKRTVKGAMLERRAQLIRERLEKMGLPQGVVAPPEIRQATAGQAKAAERQAIVRSVRAQHMEQRARKLSEHIEKLKKQMGGLENLTDAGLEKVREQVRLFQDAAQRVPEYVPHVLTEPARRWMSDLASDDPGRRFQASSRIWSDKDPHAIAREFVDRWGVPLTARDVNRFILDADALAKEGHMLLPAAREKLEWIGKEFPKWFQESQRKAAMGLGARTQEYLGKNQLLQRWFHRAPVADQARFFDLNPERIMAARVGQMSKAIKGAELYGGLAEMAQKGHRGVVRPQLAGKRALSAEGLNEALDLVADATAGIPKGYVPFDEVIRRLDELAAAAGTPKPKGWQEHNSIKALKGLAFHPDIADEVVRTAGKLTNDAATNQALKYYDAGLSFWKRWVLVSPAYVVRNMIGNFANNFYADIGMGAYARALNVQRGQGITILGRKFSAREFEDLARQWDVWKGGHYSQVFKEHMETLLLRRDSKASKALNLLPDWVFQGNNYVEMNARLAHFIDKLEKGLSPGEAARSVTKYLFDYGEATKFEDQIMRRTVFFYSWLRNNTALQVGQMFHEPWKVLAPVKLARSMEDSGEAPKDLREIQPEWTSRMLNAYIGRDEKTGDIKMLTQFGLPMEDVLRLDWQELAGQGSPLLRIPVELVTGRRMGFGRGEGIEEYDRAYSLLKVLPESIKDWLDFEEIVWPNGSKAYRMDPWKLYALTNNPFSRLYTQLGKVFDERKSVFEKIMATMTGVKIVGFHEESARVRTARENLNRWLAQQERKGRIGISKRFYARLGAELRPAEAAALQEQKRLGEVARKVYAARDSGAGRAGTSSYSEYLKKYGVKNPDDPRHHYDYRAAYEAGVVPVKWSALPEKDRAEDIAQVRAGQREPIPSDAYMWPDEFKKAGHPVPPKGQKKVYREKDATRAQ